MVLDNLSLIEYIAFALKCRFGVLHLGPRLNFMEYNCQQCRLINTQPIKCMHMNPLIQTVEETVRLTLTQLSCP